MHKCRASRAGMWLQVIRKPRRFHFILAHHLPQQEASTVWSKVAAPAPAVPSYCIYPICQNLPHEHISIQGRLRNRLYSECPCAYQDSTTEDGQRREQILENIKHSLPYLLRKILNVFHT